VEGTACTRGIAASTITLGIIAVILDDPAILLVSGSGMAFLFIRYLIFMKKVRETAMSVVIVRTLSPSLVRQGSRACVQVEVTLRVSDLVRVEYQETCPGSCTSDPKDPRTGMLSSGQYTGTVSYSVIPLVHGFVLFPGGILCIRDPFFILDLPLTRPAYTGPALMVQPYPVFAKTGGSPSFNREMERIGPHQGFDVRTLRPYLPGDDLRRIDWKMSARRGTTYVREYMSLEEGQAMLIVDLPDHDLPYDAARFSRMVSVVSGFIESSLLQKEPISLLLISGPNFCDTSYSGRNLSGFLQVLRKQFYPRTRLHHWYRKSGRSDLKKHRHLSDWYAMTVSQNAKESECIMRIQHIYDRHLLHGGISQFQAHLARIIRGKRITDIMVFSLCEGDVSHIREIEAVADLHHIRFLVKVPGPDDGTGQHLRRILGGIRIEAI
jgi:uncharacterized protein (DUF58 family)